MIHLYLSGYISGIYITHLYIRPWHDTRAPVHIKKKEAWAGDEKPTLR